MESSGMRLGEVNRLFDAGQTTDARKLLRELLLADRRNLDAWILLWKRGVASTKEELTCLQNILRIDPEHEAAARRLDELRLRGEIPVTSGNGLTNRSTNHLKRKNQKGQSNALIFLVSMVVPLICACIFGSISYQAGYFDSILFSSSMTRTAVAAENASCQLLIEKAMKASAEYCSQIDSNKACYGNNTLKADLVPGATDRFDERGDIVSVDQLQRIVASPLKPQSDEWGIAVLKVLANLPRSLPGQTVTMVVFGNTTLDNQSGNLESFFFSSELGQIQCEKVPEDGIMISVPDGEGVSFMVNGSELTLMGDASITAVKNGKMEVNLYEGAGRIVSNGQEEYFEAGEQVSVDLGGENGTDSISVPSDAVPISQEDLETACLLTGQYCDVNEITPVPADVAQQTLQAELGITTTPTLAKSLTPTRRPSLTFTNTPTQWVLASNTPSKVPTNTIKPTAVVTRTRTITPGGPTLTPSRTPTRTRTPTMTLTRTPTRTRTPTITPGGPTLTFTNTPTVTSTVTQTSTVTTTSTPTFTPTVTHTPTRTSTVTLTPPPTETNTPGGTCGNVSAGSLTFPNTNELQMTITNSTGSTIRMDSLRVDWVEFTNQAVRQVSLDGVQIFNGTDPNTPSLFPSERAWDGSASDRDIGPGTVVLLIQFEETIVVTGNTVEPTFDIGCSVSSSN
jgi:hypothetical protein